MLMWKEIKNKIIILETNTAQNIVDHGPTRHILQPTFYFYQLWNVEGLIIYGITSVLVDVFLNESPLKHSARHRRHHGLLGDLIAD